MVQTRAPSDPLTSLVSALRGFVALSAQLLAGLMLVLVAGLVALVTAIAGITLAAAAIAMRLSASRKARPAYNPAVTETGITLEARPTPRGWTVE
jgi:predicted lipid-binding transport protein (Tim44 family)